MSTHTKNFTVNSLHQRSRQRSCMDRNGFACFDVQRIMYECVRPALYANILHRSICPLHKIECNIPQIECNIPPILAYVSKILCSSVAAPISRKSLTERIYLSQSRNKDNHRSEERRVGKECRYRR